jgi:hypothetical protein
MHVDWVSWPAGLLRPPIGCDAGLAAVGGTADLTWAAAGVAAIVYGLILPPTTRHLVIAWLCATVASLAKNEGLLTALLIFLLIAIRYRSTLFGLVRYGPSKSGSAPLAAAAGPGLSSTQSNGTERAVFSLLPAVPFAIVMAAPGLVWALLIRREGISSYFIGHSPETLAQRAHPTLVAFADHLHIFPVAAAVAIAGSLALRGTRSRLELGNPVWLWLAVAGSLVAIALTYLFGAVEIHWWLTTSISRTTIFTILALYADLAIWLVVALTGNERTEDNAKSPAAIEDEFASFPATLIAESGGSSATAERRL